jgi:hypothetical protein
MAVFVHKPSEGFVWVWDEDGITVSFGDVPDTDLVAGVDGSGPWIDGAVVSDDAGVDVTGPWVDSTSDSILVGIDVTGPWITSVEVGGAGSDNDLWSRNARC